MVSVVCASVVHDVCVRMCVHTSVGMALCSISSSVVIHMAYCNITHTCSLRTDTLSHYHNMPNLHWYVHSDRKCILSESLPTMLIFFHITHHAFSMSKGTVTTDTTNAMHAHMINLLFHVYRKYHSSSRQHCTRACSTCVIRALITHDISLYVWNNIIVSHEYHVLVSIVYHAAHAPSTNLFMYVICMKCFRQSSNFVYQSCVMWLTK